MKKILHTCKRFAKKIYMAIPIEMSTKLKIKGFIFRLFSPFLKNTNAYKDWKAYTGAVDIVGETKSVIRISKPDREEYISQIMGIPYIGNRDEYMEESITSVSINEDDVKYLAFYLPQFHPFPENDEWWGKGFTEWTNVTKAVPQFVGHNQPRLAGELGYYDLRNVGSIKRQAELAKKYGIFGFCIYYYWFDGKKLMDTPLRILAEHKEIDMPFCLCWANENWSRKWDGKNQDILIAQNYDESFPLKFITDIVPYFNDERYIKIKGKPVFIIYNANEIPNLKQTISFWREYCRNNGIGEIHLLGVDFAMNAESKSAGFDGIVEFPPHSVYHYGMDTINDELTIIDDNYAGRIFDYSQIVKEKQYLKRNLDYYKGIFLGWDNTARRPKNATVYHRFSIAAFKEWLTDITNYTIENRAADDRYVFINAWNEWAEGTYLEPDRKYGYAALNTVRNVLKDTSIRTKRIIYVSHDACYNGAQLLSLNIIEQLRKVFHYEVYVVLIGDGVMYEQFCKVASDIICLEREKHPEVALEAWVKRSGCKKALCNTVVTGDVLKQLSELGVHCVSMIHEMENVVKFYHCEEKLAHIAEKAEKIVFASDYVRESVEKIHKIPEEKKVIMTQGIYKANLYGAHNEENRKEIRNELNLPADTKIALGVGFGDHRKGIDLFVKAGIEVCNRDSEAAFVWVGEVEPIFYEELSKLIEDCGCKDRVIFAGPTDDVFRFYSAADIFVLTSREDPFPTVVLEAMNAGLPVAAFKDGGGYVENVTDHTGFLVDMEDWESLAEGICKMFGDKREILHMGECARKYAEEHFRFIDYIYGLLALLGEKYNKVSVVVPNYNYARYLEKRCDSVLEQDYPIYEVILLDDVSSDNSMKIMERYVAERPLQVKLFKNEENSGNVFNQWEKGCNLARGEYVWIAEADDLSKHTFLSSVMEKMSNDQEIVLGYTQSYMMDENGNVTSDNYFVYTDDVDDKAWKSDYVSDAREEIVKRLASKNTIPNVSAVVFKKQDFTKMFTEAKKYHVAGDWAFYVKLLEQGGKVAFVAESLNYHRRHSNSVTTDLKAQIHFDEICQMQDYVMNTYGEAVDKENVLAYRENVRKILGVGR